MDWIGKKVCVFYDDQTDSVGRRDGILKNTDSDYIILKVPQGGEIGIPKARVIRIELTRSEL